jgi:hypothetical protein
MTIVDPASWRDMDRVEITGGSVSRSVSGLRQSADITCTDYDPDREQWVRVYLDAAQAGDVVHVPLFTGLSSVPERSTDGSRTEYPLACYSVLKPAEDILLDRGWYAMTGQSSGDVIEALLSDLPAPVTVRDGSPALIRSIIAEDGETQLSMVDKILTAIGWRLRIEGDGSIEVCPADTEPRATFGDGNDVIEPQLTVRKDWFSCPNVFRAISGDRSAVARDDSEDSMLSTVSRGREIWMEDRDGQLSDSEGLEQYAERRLAEEQAYAYSVRYRRRYDPAVTAGDLVRLHYPGQGLQEDHTVISQSITLGLGAAVEEEVQR